MHKFDTNPTCFKTCLVLSSTNWILYFIDFNFELRGRFSWVGHTKISKQQFYFGLVRVKQTLSTISVMLFVIMNWENSLWILFIYFNPKNGQDLIKYEKEVNIIYFVFPKILRGFWMYLKLLRWREGLDFSCLSQNRKFKKWSLC